MVPLSCSLSTVSASFPFRFKRLLFLRLSARYRRLAMRAVRALTGGQQAVNELEVFLRAVADTQRRWAKRIAAQEAKVRRCMMVEDHCRKRLRRSVLRFTNERLKRLVSTDPLGHVEPKLPPASAFGAFDIPPHCVNGFGVFVMAKLHEFPSCVLDAPRVGAIADLLAAWEILPPFKKERYEAYAESVRDVTTATGTASSSGSSTNCEQRTAGVEGDAGTPTNENEAAAYGRFVRCGRRQLEAVLGPVSSAAWLGIATREWESLTLRQKRCYLSKRTK
ncbi:hypothetical protein, conserved [Trypanosoma brucei brucei TREU927]|uniref:Uncharacterized protein n=1 Tax=Trypanosoma brucei brucei (strain 927/4 GUTat10.1) TaxID=185431 RepID=Q38C67_TRYB2|nr:hypothetical protein, conserved [Trypanosoma brucei brucei TREU927]EAN77603.1 hypothetical protein, conserved [Trypanosoma brucei brucei TREU927]